MPRLVETMPADTISLEGFQPLPDSLGVPLGLQMETYAKANRVLQLALSIQEKANANENQAEQNVLQQFVLTQPLTQLRDWVTQQIMQSVGKSRDGFPFHDLTPETKNDLAILGTLTADSLSAYYDDAGTLTITDIVSESQDEGPFSPK